VDVGSKKDGLVHIKDVSKDYFIQDLGSRFIAGQDLDVWVKFVDGERWKLGLQLFPVDHRLNSPLRQSASNIEAQERIPIGALKSEVEVTGTVVKVSNFGVYVDVGCVVDAFLPRRKMKIGRKRRQERPWELHPIGSQISCYVHESDSTKMRLSLTTYAPLDWDAMLAPIVSDVSEDSDENLMMSDDEELGGSTRAANLRALERTLALNLDGDDDGDGDLDEEYDDDKEVEDYVFSNPAGIDRAQVLIDDFEEAPRKMTKLSTIADNSASNENDPFKTSDNDQSLDDLYDELSVNKGYITIRDLFRWDYFQEIYDDGEVDDEVLESLLRDAGGRSGKLSEQSFPVFVNLLADHLGLENEAIDVNDLSITSSKQPEMTETTNNVVTGSSNQDTFDSDFEELQAEFSSLGMSSENRDIEKLYESKPGSNDVMKYVFDGVAGKKGYVTFDDIATWDFVESFKLNNGISNDQLQKMFAASAKTKKISLDRNGFSSFLDSMIDFENGLMKSSAKNTDAVVSKTKTAVISVVKGGKPSIPDILQSINTPNFDKSGEEIGLISDDIDGHYGDEDDDLYDVRELFESMCKDENSDTISLSCAL